MSSPKGLYHLSLSSCLLLSWIFHTLLTPSESRSIQNDYDWKELDMHTASQCFNVPGVPELNLRCPVAELIRVQKSFYGVAPTDTDERDVCEYDSIQQHCVQYTSLKENCMGRNDCTLPVSNPFLTNCEGYANYMQVNYTCIPREIIHDICQDVEVTSWQGFIRSPNYPGNYASSQKCQCQLKTQDRSILLWILDFSLNISRQHDGKCREDKLNIESWGDKCNPVVPEGLPEKLVIMRQALTLSFTSDHKYQDRGFWLEFKGSNGGKVTMTCGQVIPETPVLSNKTPDDPDEWESAAVNESTTDFEDATDNNIVLIDDTDIYPTEPESTSTEELDNQFTSNTFDEFDTYDFMDHQESFRYNVGEIQLATGIVVSVLILIAVIIIIVLVFRR